MPSKKKKIQFSPFRFMAVKTYQEVQETRKAHYNRTRDIIRRKIEKIPMRVQEEKKKRKDFLNKFKDKQILKYLSTLENKDKITPSEKKYLSQTLKLAMKTQNLERHYKNLMLELIQDEPIWNKWLKDIKGIGEVITAKCLKYFYYCEVKIYDENNELVFREKEDPEKIDKFVNQDNLPDGWKFRGYPRVSNMRSHVGMNPQATKGLRKGEKINYNPQLKAFCWNIAQCAMKHRTPVYRRIYEKEKKRYQHPSKRLNKREITGKTNIVGDFLAEKVGDIPKNTKIMSYPRSDSKTTTYDKLFKEAKKAKRDKVLMSNSDAHINNQALRKVAVLFLSHYWAISRLMKGLKVTKPYPLAHLGHSKYIMPPNSPFTEEELTGQSEPDYDWIEK